MTIRGINLIYHTLGDGGGMERYVSDIVKAIHRRNIPLRVICRRSRWSGAPDDNLQIVALPDRTPFPRLNNALFEARASKYCHPEWTTIGISRVPAKVDMAIAGGNHIEYLRRKEKKPGFFHRRTIRNEATFYERAGIVVAHSEETRREIIRHYGTQAICIYPPVDTDTFSLAAREKRERVRAEIGIGNRMMLLFPSNNHSLKGADLILEALRSFAGKIVLAVASKAPIHDPNVINLGYRTEMPALYAAADATILASKYETFGLVGPESVLCGTPAIFPETVGASEILSGPACIRFERTVKGLTEALSATFAKFASGDLPLENPGQHIKYAFSIDAHIDALLANLPKETAGGQ